MPESFIPVWMSIGEAEEFRRFLQDEARSTEGEFPEREYELIDSALNEERPRSFLEVEAERQAANPSSDTGGAGALREALEREAKDADAVTAQREALKASLRRIRAAAESDEDLAGLAVRSFLLAETDAVAMADELAGHDPDSHPLSPTRLATRLREIADAAVERGKALDEASEGAMPTDLAKLADAMVKGGATFDDAFDLRRAAVLLDALTSTQLSVSPDPEEADCDNCNGTGRELVSALHPERGYEKCGDCGGSSKVPFEPAGDTGEEPGREGGEANG